MTGLTVSSEDWNDITDWLGGWRGRRQWINIVSKWYKWNVQMRLSVTECMYEWLYNWENLQDYILWMYMRCDVMTIGEYKRNV